MIDFFDEIFPLTKKQEEQEKLRIEQEEAQRAEEAEAPQPEEVTVPAEAAEENTAVSEAEDTSAPEEAVSSDEKEPEAEVVAEEEVTEAEETAEEEPVQEETAQEEPVQEEPAQEEPAAEPEIEEASSEEPSVIAEEVEEAVTEEPVIFEVTEQESAPNEEVVEEEMVVSASDTFIEEDEAAGEPTEEEARELIEFDDEYEGDFAFETDNEETYTFGQPKEAPEEPAAVEESNNISISELNDYELDEPKMSLEKDASNAALHAELLRIIEKLDNMEKSHSAYDDNDSGSDSDGFAYEYDERYYAEDETPAYRYPNAGRNTAPVRRQPQRPAPKKSSGLDINLNTGSLIKAGALVAATVAVMKLLGKKDK